MGVIMKSLISTLIIILIIGIPIVIIWLSYRAGAKIRSRKTDKLVKEGVIEARPENFYNYAYLFAVRNADFNTVKSAMNGAVEKLLIKDAVEDPNKPGTIRLNYQNKLMEKFNWRAYITFVQTDGDRFVYQFGFSMIRTQNGIVVDVDGMNKLLTFVERTLYALDPNLAHAKRPIERH